MHVHRFFFLLLSLIVVNTISAVSQYYGLFTEAVLKDDLQTDANEDTAAVAVLAVLFSALLILNVVVVLWVLRRGWTLPCAGNF